MDYPTLILRDAPSFYFPLDEAGSTVLDRTGHGFTGTPAGAISAGTAPFAASGASKLLTKPAGWPSATAQPKFTINAPGSMALSALPHPPQAFSLEGWIRLVSSSAAPMGSGYTLLDLMCGTEQQWTLDASTGGTGFGYPFFLFTLYHPAAGTAEYAYTDTLPYNTAWHYYVLTYDPAAGTPLVVYADTIAYVPHVLATFAQADAAVTHAVIGGASSTGNATAEYAHIAIYDYALSAHQVRCHYTMATLGTQDCYPTLLRFTYAPGGGTARWTVPPGRTSRITYSG